MTSPSSPQQSTIPNKNAPLSPQAITIEKMVYGGDGLGRLDDGRVIFANPVVAGDTVYGTPEKDKQRLVLKNPEIKTASSDRVVPPCAHALECGGCDWQALSETAQRHWKAEIVTESLKRVGKIQSPNVKPMQHLPVWQYRHTVTWQIDVSGHQPALAYFKKESHDLMAFNTCDVLSPTLQELAKYLQANADMLRGMDTIKARCNRNGEIVLLIIPEQNTSVGRISDAFSKLIAETAVVGIQIISGKKTSSQPVIGTQVIEDTIAGHAYQCDVTHFMQVSPDGSELILDALSALLKPIEAQPNSEHSQHLLELYCGTGTLGLSLSTSQDNIQQLTGIEGNTSAIALAKENSQQHDVKAHFTTSSVEAFIEDEENNELTVDTILVDPPRNGIKKEVLTWMANHATRAILYVSCNPSTFARDAKLLIENGWSFNRFNPLISFLKPATLNAWEALHPLSLKLK